MVQLSKDLQLWKKAIQNIYTKQQQGVVKILYPGCKNASKLLISSVSTRDEISNTVFGTAIAEIIEIIGIVEKTSFTRGGSTNLTPN